MIDRGVAVPWQAQMRTDVARDDELLDLMRRSGCHRVALGLESVDQATLDGFDKSQTVADIVTAIAACTTTASDCHGMFVLGAETDTRGDGARDRELRPRARHRHPDAEHPHSGAGHQAVRRHGGRGPHLRPRWGSTTASTSSSRRSSSRRTNCRPTCCAAMRASTRPESCWAFAARLRLTRVRDHSWCWWFARSWARRNREYLRALKLRPSAGVSGKTKDRAALASHPVP